ncbi:hypothetical protein NL676_004491 [Syzygium grande]|nr:hypothetical protein NL676_004491 [Syzygium grande]
MSMSTSFAALAMYATEVHAVSDSKRSKVGDDGRDPHGVHSSTVQPVSSSASRITENEPLRSSRFVSEKQSESRSSPRLAPQFDGLNCFETIVGH